MGDELRCGDQNGDFEQEFQRRVEVFERNRILQKLSRAYCRGHEISQSPVYSQVMGREVGFEARRTALEC
jgi:hypothetical protein